MFLISHNVTVIIAILFYQLQSDFTNISLAPEDCHLREVWVGDHHFHFTGAETEAGRFAQGPAATEEPWTPL